MRNGSLKTVVDTNIYYTFFYNPLGKSGKLLKAAAENKIELFSPDFVREELSRLIKRKLGYSENEVNSIVEALPVRWIEYELYKEFMPQTKILSHESDRPILATALAIGCGIITMNEKHFRPARKIVKIWHIDELLNEIKNKE